jgi:hypothetical protein
VIIPEAERRPVEVRLRRWDLLDSDLQKQVLEYERTIRYVVQLEGLSREEQKEVAATLPQSLRKTWDEKLGEWHALSPERRQTIYGKFQKFFELSPAERARVLETLSQKDRKEAERSLQVVQELEKLPPEEQAACLESFKNFAETPPKSDQLYLRLKAVQRWKEMSSKERDVWKKLMVVPGLGAPIPSIVSQPPRGEMKSAAPALPGASGVVSPK